MNAKSRIAVAAIVSTGAAALALRPTVGAGQESAAKLERPAVIIEVDRAALRIDAAQLRFAVSESIRAALADTEKSARAARQTRVASVRSRNGG